MVNASILIGSADGVMRGVDRASIELANWLDEKERKNEKYR